MVKFDQTLPGNPNFIPNTFAHSECIAIPFERQLGRFVVAVAAVFFLKLVLT